MFYEDPKDIPFTYLIQSSDNLERYRKEITTNPPVAEHPPIILSHTLSTGKECSIKLDFEKRESLVCYKGLSYLPFLRIPFRETGKLLPYKEIIQQTINELENLNKGNTNEK